MNKSRQSPVFLLGVISLIAVIIALILASFAVLSYVSASNDYKLSQKAAQVSRQYYAADAEAEAKLSFAINNIGNTELLEQSGYGVTKSGGVVALEFTTDISDVKYIQSKVMVYSDGSIERLVWKTCVKQER